MNALCRKGENQRDTNTKRKSIWDGGEKWHFPLQERQQSSGEEAGEMTLARRVYCFCHNCKFIAFASCSGWGNIPGWNIPGEHPRDGVRTTAPRSVLQTILGALQTQKYFGFKGIYCLFTFTGCKVKVSTNPAPQRVKCYIYYLVKFA